MLPQIKTFQAKKLVGKKIRMSLSDNKTGKTFELWRSFMPERRKIKNIVGTDLYSVQVYDKTPDFKNFNPDEVSLDRWAAVEVADFAGAIPDGMQTHELAGGLYAVFIYRGTSDNFDKTFQYIFGEWLPRSGYDLDDRQHFEILGEKYRPDDPDSQEEICIPVRAK